MSSFVIKSAIALSNYSKNDIETYDSCSDLFRENVYMPLFIVAIATVTIGEIGMSLILLRLFLKKVLFLSLAYDEVSLPPPPPPFFCV